MNREPTTKEILREKTARGDPSPLYSADALVRLSTESQQWTEAVLRREGDLAREAVIHTVLGSDIARRMVYTPLDTAGLDYSQDIGYPGNPPYARGIHANMYRGKTFTMRQLAGAGSCEYVNQRIRMLLDHGATGVNVVFDLPTIQMFDSDEPEAKAQVGIVGVPIDSAQDMAVLFGDIPIDKLSVSVVTHYPRNTAILFPMYLVMAERQGLSWEMLAGSVQNDFIMETVVRSASEHIRPRDAFRIQCDNIEFLRRNVPKWNVATLNGYNLREFGTSAITEMAVALANGIETLKEMARRGHSPEQVAERLAFFWCCGNDFFEEVARLRACRRLWYRIMRYRFEASNPRAMLMRCHVQTSGISLTREEPMNNIVRASYHALAAIFGGAQSLHVNSYDEAYSVPSEDASLLSLRTQQILQVETGITQVVDPLGGSYYLEKLTDEMEAVILDELDEIERMGGIVAAVEKGWLHSKVLKFIQREQQMIDAGNIQVVGRNYLKDYRSTPPAIHIQEYDPTLQDELCRKLAVLRDQRDNQKVRACLDGIGQACRGSENVTERCIAAARAGATKGEMRRAFAEALESWTPPHLS